MNKDNVVFSLVIAAVVMCLFFYVDEVKANREYNFTTSKRVVRQVKHKINKANIKSGKIILVRAFRTSMFFVYLVTSVVNRPSHVIYLPTQAKFYTHGYRNIVRHLSLIPHWLTGQISYANTHQFIPLVYRYNEVQLPSFVKKMLFWIPQQSWDDENNDEKLLSPRERRLLTQTAKPDTTVPFGNLTWYIPE